jgi:8-oxo-dGTP diphosphatase
MSEVPRVGVGVLIARGHRVLLLKRENVHGAGTWSTPGGHLDFGESPEQCAIREVREEVGLNITAVRFRAVTNDLFNVEGKHYITLWMEGESLSGEAVVNAAHEMSEVGWFAWDELPHPLFLSFQNLIDGRCYPPPFPNPTH